jgi:threonine dehydrogenase-like Zn-dependent dehydrogenase
MKALYLKGARECGIKDKPEPQPNGHDPILKVLACGICGSDVSPWKIGYNPLWAMINVPLDNGPTMGHEFVARIEDPGDAAERGFKKGDRVTMMPFDWCGNCPACRNGKEGKFHRLPEGFVLFHAAFSCLAFLFPVARW